MSRSLQSAGLAIRRLTPCRPGAWGVVVLVVCGLVCPASHRAGAAEPAAISGRVTYTADAARPWRYARYYVKGRETGSLAEAVVALRGTGLKKWPAPAAAATAAMDQVNFQFVPETLAIRVGDAVQFKNSDTTTHNVKSSSPLATFNVNMAAGDDYTYQFNRAGGLRNPIELGCIYHGGMRAWIYVFDHPYFTVTGADGTFRFDRVPPGEYTLEMTHPAGGLRWRQTIHIVGGNDQSVAIGVSPDDKQPN